MRIIRIILTVIGVLGIVVYGAVIPRRVLNIGNITGLAVSGLLILAGRKAEGIRSFFVYAWSRGTTGHIVTVMILLIPAVILFLIVLETAMIVRQVHVKPKAGACAIVLGCQVKGERPSLALEERIDAAYGYLEKNKDAFAILSGGRGKGERISEAECMYRELTKRGIAGERLFKEDKSTTTAENFAFSKEILSAHGAGPAVAVVTSDFHLYRAALIAKRNRLIPGSVPARTARFLLPTYWVRELYAILYEWQYGI